MKKFHFVNKNYKKPYLPDFTRLHCLQSIWQFSGVVLPPEWYMENGGKSKKELKIIYNFAV